MSRSKARRSADAALRKLYDSLPRLECKGLCTDSCGPIPTTDLEVLQIEEARGGPLPMHMPDANGVQAISCPLLTTDGRCSVHAARPMICRQFGLVDHPLMRCPYGCKPSRYLTEQESRALLRKAAEISARYTKEEPPDGRETMA